jgi:hypothetical protein
MGFNYHRNSTFFDDVAPFALTSDGDKDSRIQANGYVKSGRLKLGGGWIGCHVNTASAAAPDVHSNLFYAGAQYFLSNDRRGRSGPIAAWRLQDRAGRGVLSASAFLRE